LVQTLPSSQVTGEPTHAPAAQMSPEVQALLSVHGSVLVVYTQPDAGSHESVVHTLPSSQLVGAPGAHAPAAQASPEVQGLPSSHGIVLLANTQPDAGLHESLVQALPSSHVMGETMQSPLLQTSLVQALPSLHVPLKGTYWH
jgi:hypothetical protein